MTTSPRFRFARLGSFIALAIVILSNMGLWWYFNRPFLGSDYTGMIEGVSFSPYRADQDPRDNKELPEKQLDEDLALLAGKVRKVRTYSVAHGLEKIPALARKYNIKTDVGLFINADPANNAEQIEILQNIFKDWSATLNISSILVGNEILLTKTLPKEELINLVRQVRRSTFIPVSTAETWEDWMANPDLANEVDFLAVHVFPYWEGIPIHNAVGHIQAQYALLQKTFPGKKIVLAEVGWPSEGRLKSPEGSGGILPKNLLSYSVPDETNQVKFLREFLNFAVKNKVEYHIMEAFDQLWKKNLEGDVGAYWGLYDAYRQPKFPLSGPFVANPVWPWLSAIAIIIATLPTILILRFQKKLSWQGTVFFALLINLLVSFLVWVAYVYSQQYLQMGSVILWTVMIFLQLLLVIVVIGQSFEAAELLSHNTLSREFKPATFDPNFAPKVSIHVPIYNEPVEMVKMTIGRLLEMDYPNFEVLVIDNNTKDEAVWKPIGEYCATLGANVKFFHLPHCPGFKAGALNFALDHTAADAEFIAVIDSDYLVKNYWLKSTIPYFKNPKVGFVQAPQDHYDADLNLFKNMCNWEYMGFFHLGMLHRNERNAIIQHGTMTIIRKSALENVGRWSEWCICEDAELGLRLFKEGWESVYINHVFGQGVTPDSFSAYKGQRYRWAYGAMQILKRHARDIFLPSKNLTWAQKFHFATGWQFWIGDALNYVLAVLGIIWSSLSLIWPQYVGFPVTLFLIPVIALFFIKVFQNIFLYMFRVKSTFKEALKAAIAGLALTHTVSVATVWGLITKKIPFKRTPKWQKKFLALKDVFASTSEIVLFLILWALAIAIAIKYGHSDPESLVWSIVLILMSTPYLAAIVMALLPKET